MYQQGRGFLDSTAAAAAAASSIRNEVTQVASLHFAAPFYPPPTTLYYPPSFSSQHESDMMSRWSTNGRTFNISLSDRGHVELHQDYFAMSSLARRACYKCGTVGHFAGKLLAHLF